MSPGGQGVLRAQAEAVGWHLGRVVGLADRTRRKTTPTRDKMRRSGGGALPGQAHPVARAQLEDAALHASVGGFKGLSCTPSTGCGWFWMLSLS